MPHHRSIISPKSIGFVAALVLPMLLIPTSGHATSNDRNKTKYRTGTDYQDWSFLNRPIRVKQGYGGSQYKRKSDRADLRQFFDGAAPRDNKAMNRARNKRANRAARRGTNRSRRHGYSGDYYEDEVAMSCVSPRKIHRRLHVQGWRNFHNLRIRANVLMFKARQSRQGRQSRDLTYNLRIDRCTGALIKAKLQLKDMWYIRWMRRISSLY